MPQPNHHTGVPWCARCDKPVDLVTMVMVPAPQPAYRFGSVEPIGWVMPSHRRFTVRCHGAEESMVIPASLIEDGDLEWGVAFQR